MGRTSMFTTTDNDTVYIIADNDIAEIVENHGGVYMAEYGLWKVDAPKAADLVAHLHSEGNPVQVDRSEDSYNEVARYVNAH